MTETMKALVKARPEPGIWMQDMPMPQIGPTDVLIKIAKTTICGTDIHIYNWDKWSQATVPVPLIIGHEYVGVIVEVGPEVETFKVGDRVSGESGPYGYLARSIAGFSPAAELAGRIREAGFAACGWQPASGGIVAIHTAFKAV